jgi:PncC family amidohydrolase
VFLAGFVTYSEQAKIRDLGVDAAILTEHGVVSESVAAAMARGAATKSGARLAISVTGIAGPDGGTPEQPVGTVCFGLYFDGETSTVQRRFGDLGRELLRQRSVREGLVWLCRTLARID